MHKTPKGWRLLRHTDRIALRNVRFIVNEAGKQRVRREQKKFVHAFVEGEERSQIGLIVTLIKYNPYQHETFVQYPFNDPAVDGIDVLCAETGSVWSMPNWGG
jgi:hypothetical protein